MSFIGLIVLCKFEGYKFFFNVLCENVNIIIIRVFFGCKIKVLKVLLCLYFLIWRFI